MSESTAIPTPSMAEQRRLLAEAVVMLAEALGAKVSRPLTGPEILMLAADAAEEARRLRHFEAEHEECASRRERMSAVVVGYSDKITRALEQIDAAIEVGADLDQHEAEHAVWIRTLRRIRATLRSNG